MTGKHKYIADELDGVRYNKDSNNQLEAKRKVIEINIYSLSLGAMLYNDFKQIFLAIKAVTYLVLKTILLSYSEWLEKCHTQQRR